MRSSQGVENAFYVACIEDVVNFLLLSDADKVKRLLEKDMIHNFAKFVVELYNRRRKCLYDPN